MEEIGSVPSALSEPRGAVHCCDNQCSQHAFRFNRIGAMVTEEGGEAHTISASGAATKGSSGKASSRRRRRNGERLSSVKLFVANCGRFFGMEQFMRGMWRILHHQKSLARTVSADAAKELESPVKEVLEQVKKHTDMGCNGYMMRRAYYAERSGNWEGFKEKFQKTGEISEWAFAGVKEAHDKVASEDVGPEHRTGHLASEGVTLSYEL